MSQLMRSWKVGIPILIGLFAAHLRLRLSLANPFSFDWLWLGDWANSAAGFLYFVDDAWRWPLGKIENLQIPLGSAIGYTDSLPIVAIFFKALRAFIPFPFHYLGLWLVFCFVMSACFGFLIFQRLKLTTWQASLGALVLALAPPLLFRIGHVSLCSQFLLLMQFYFYLAFSQTLHRKYFVASLIGVLLASGIHPYLWAMTLLMSLSVEWTAWQGARRRREKLILPALGVATKIVFSYLCLWAFGYFLPSDKADGGAAYYKSDLTVFFNPMGEPAIMPRISAGAGQYEAYSYFGIGSILLLALAVFHPRARGLLKEFCQKHRSFLILALAAWVYALSPEITFAGRTLIDVSGLYRALGPLPDIFRSTGRFTWPLFYFLSLALWWVAFRFFEGKGRYLLGGLLLLQIYDLKPYYDNLPPRTERPVLDYEERLLKLSAEKGIERIIMIPQGRYDECGGPNERSLDAKNSIIFFGALYHFSTNTGDISRVPKNLIQAACHESRQQIDLDRPLPGHLYVILKTEWRRMGLEGRQFKNLLCEDTPANKICWARGSL